MIIIEWTLKILSVFTLNLNKFGQIIQMRQNHKTINFFGDIDIYFASVEKQLKSKIQTSVMSKCFEAFIHYQNQAILSGI